MYPRILELGSKDGPYTERREALLWGLSPPLPKNWPSEFLSSGTGPGQSGPTSMPYSPALYPQTWVYLLLEFLKHLLGLGGRHLLPERLEILIDGKILPWVVCLKLQNNEVGSLTGWDGWGVYPLLPKCFSKFVSLLVSIHISYFAPYTPKSPPNCSPVGVILLPPPIKPH